VKILYWSPTTVDAHGHERNRLFTHVGRRFVVKSSMLDRTSKHAAASKRRRQTSKRNAIAPPVFESCWSGRGADGSRRVSI